MEELLGLVQLRGEGEDDVDGDGGLPDCCCFPSIFVFFCVFPSLPFLSCCLCYYWKAKTQTNTMTKTMVDGDGGPNRGDRGSSSCVLLCTPSIGSFFFCSFCPSFFFPHVLAPPWLFLFILPRFCDFPSHRFSFSGIYNQRMPCGRMDFNAGHPFLSFFLSFFG